VSHGHVLVDGHRVDIPSYQLRAGQEIEVAEGMRKNAQFLEALETAKGRSVPDWLELDAANFKGKVTGLPAREHVTLPVQEQLIVELYSK
jgi:small subunit ribosomal protein S4